MYNNDRAARFCSSKKRTLVASMAAASVLAFAGNAQAYQFQTDNDWTVHLDTSLQYTIGVRTSSRNSAIAGDPTLHQSNYIFDRGDIVTNRGQALFQLQGVHVDNYGFRLSAAVWKDWAYKSDDVSANPRFPDSFNVYPSGRFSNYTEKFHIQGDEILDAFVFASFDIGETPVDVRAGRFTQQWGNAFFFGFSNIAYSQQPTDFIKAFTQPGTEVQELFLPRGQVMATIHPTRDLSISAQYFLEFEENRFPEGGTFLGAADVLFQGPQTGGAVTDIFGQPIRAGRTFKPDNVNDNFGIQVKWSPLWARGDLGFYFRKMDEVHPWTQLELLPPPAGGGGLHLSFPDNVKLYGLSYETAIGAASLGFEASYRTDTGLMSSFFSGQLGEYREGARGDIFNFIANALIPFGSTPLWDTSTLIAEVTHTYLDKVTENENVFLGRGHAACVDTLDPSQPGSIRDGCASKNATAAALLFIPEWLQPIGSVNLSMPIFVQYGIKGNPAYSAGSFFAEEALTWSIGLSAEYKARHTVTLQYQEFYWKPISSKVDNGFGERIYPGGNGPYALNDKGWVSLQFQTSF